MQTAISTARPGDTVLVGPGTYPGPIQTARDGAAGRPISIIGQNARIQDGGHDRTVLIRNNWIVLQGFEIIGGDSGIWVFGGSHVRVLHNDVHASGGECVRVKVRAHNDEIAYNHVHDCGATHFTVSGGDKNGEGIYVGTAPEQLNRDPGTGRDTTSNNWIHGNRIESRAECVDMKEGTHDNLVQHNTCDGTDDPAGSGFDSRGNHNFIVQNLSENNAGAGIRLGGDTANDGINNVVRGNQLINNAGDAVKVLRQPQNAICHNLLHGNKDVSNLTSVSPEAACPATADTLPTTVPSGGGYGG